MNLNDAAWSSAKASGAITARRFVKATALGVIAMASTAKDNIVGASGQTGIADTKTGDFNRFGIQRLKAGGTFAAGDALTSDASGKAIKAKHGDSIGGYAVEPAVNGDEPEVFVMPGVPARTMKLIGALPAFASNDSVVVAADLEHDGIYTVPQTGAASTVTLPADAPDGIRIHTVADAALNDHTVQYRDATGPVNLTAALTANKRHFQSFGKLAGVWYALSGVTAP